MRKKHVEIKELKFLEEHLADENEYGRKGNLILTQTIFSRISKKSLWKIRYFLKESFKRLTFQTESASFLRIRLFVQDHALEDRSDL